MERLNKCCEDIPQLSNDDDRPDFPPFRGDIVEGLPKKYGNEESGRNT